MKPKKLLLFICFKVYKRLKFPFILIPILKFLVSQRMPEIRHLFYI